MFNCYIRLPPLLPWRAPMCLVRQSFRWPGPQAAHISNHPTTLPISFTYIQPSKNLSNVLLIIYPPCISNQYSEVPCPNIQPSNNNHSQNVPTQRFSTLRLKTSACEPATAKTPSLSSRVEPGIKQI